MFFENLNHCAWVREEYVQIKHSSFISGHKNVPTMSWEVHAKVWEVIENPITSAGIHFPEQYCNIVDKNYCFT